MQVTLRRYPPTMERRSLDDVLVSEDLAIGRTSTVDQVADRLRTMITDGRLPQGEHLREMPLVEAFGVSRTTVRDAIRALTSEGLVSHQFHRGAIVRILSDEDIADVYKVRRLLELPALDLVQGGGDEARARVEDALDACEGAADRRDYAAFVEAELDFHAAIVGYHGSPRLDHFFVTVVGAVRLALSVLGEDSHPSTTHLLADRYRGIFEAANRGDVAEARRSLSAHLNTYEARLRATV